MLGSEETKHLAIAAACGVAVGAVAGALGYAALGGATPLQSRKNSCVSCTEKSSPRRSVLTIAGNGDQSPASEENTAKLLENLSKRMESLEQAVRTKLISKSGTNSSIAGYLTARESSGESDDDFQDVGEDSSGNEDIFFHTSATPRRSKAKPVTVDNDLELGSAADLSRASDILGSDVSYVEIDRCLCSDLHEENAKAFADLTNLNSKYPFLNSDPQFLWRFAKSVHQKNLHASDPEAKKIHAFRAKELAFEALQSPGGESIADVHKWCAITVGNIGDYVSLKEKISNGSIFKERIDSAIGLEGRDEMSFYLLGRWCYSIYMMSWVERKVATSMVSDFPSATIDEALVAFQNSEGLKPSHWVDNQLYLAKCYIEKRDYSTAMSWLDKALALDIKPEDYSSKEEVESLIAKYSAYRT